MPPLLALIDDSEPFYRLRGLHVLDALLNRTESHVLLRRTGLGQLIRNSVSTSLTYVNDISRAALVGEAVTVDIRMINVMADGDEQWRFDALSQLVIDGPMLIWRYSGDKVAFAIVAARAVSQIVEELGIGCIRFLPVR